MQPLSSTITAATLALLSACAPVATIDRAPRAGGDDTGEAGDDGAGEDTGAQADDTGSAWQACDEADLRWSAEVQDEHGRPVNHLVAGQAATLVGRVENPCTQDIVLDVDESCPVLAFEVVEGASGSGDYAAVDCPLSGAGFRLQAGEVVEARHSWSSLPDGTYELTVHFVVHGLRASTGLVID